MVRYYKNPKVINMKDDLLLEHELLLKEQRIMFWEENGWLPDPSDLDEYWDWESSKGAV